MPTHLTVADGAHELSGAVRPGESWAAAARRTAAAWHVDPVPVDLSGEVKRFALDHHYVVGVRPMTRGDLPLVARWRGQAHVARWWDQDGPATLAGVTKSYGARIDGTTPTRMWVGEVNGRSIGFVQDYRISDYPDFAMLTPDPDAIGVDYAIGEPAFVARGFGSRLLWAWMLRARRRFPDAALFFAAPDHRNAASLRVLDKVGFVRGTWFDEPHVGGATTTVVGCTLDVPLVCG